MFTVRITEFKSINPQFCRKKGDLLDNLSVILLGRYLLFSRKSFYCYGVSKGSSFAKIKQLEAYLDMCSFLSTAACLTVI